MRALLLLLALCAGCASDPSYREVRAMALVGMTEDGAALADEDAYAVLERMDRAEAELGAERVLLDEEDTSMIAGILRGIGVPEIVVSLLLLIMSLFKRPRELLKQIGRVTLQLPGLLDRHPPPPQSVTTTTTESESIVTEHLPPAPKAKPTPKLKLTRKGKAAA